MPVLKVALNRVFRPSGIRSIYSYKSNSFLKSSSRATSNPPSDQLYTKSNSSNHNDGHSRKPLAEIAALSASVAFAGWLLANHVHAKEKAAEEEDVAFGLEKSGLPLFTSEEVSRHDSKDKRIWVTFKSGVYDITDFIDKHPGGDKILMAAGGSLEPFWALYALHKRRDVFEILESHRIGNLAPEDRAESSDANDHWSNEPKRHPALTVRSKQPFNAESPPEILADAFVTPK